MGQPDLPEGFDINDPARPMPSAAPVEQFAELRRTAPVWWQSQPSDRDGFDDEGHWVLTRHADVKEVSRNDAVFSTGRTPRSSGSAQTWSATRSTCSASSC